MKKTFKDKLNNPKMLILPGVYDALSALLAQQTGFEGVYLSGASISYTRLGRSDVQPIHATPKIIKIPKGKTFFMTEEVILVVIMV